MRIERVTAGCFGALDGDELDLAPGFNVVHGLNGAGKSTWHGAIYAALTGGRDERNRPWAGGDWEAGAQIVLADGRQIRVEQDLESRTGRAVDVLTGDDVTDEIRHDGMPDATRWLGLDRAIFPATAGIGQAEILDVTIHGPALQEQLARAAASAGGQETAEGALDIVGEVRRHADGAEANPMRSAVDALARARETLETAQHARAEFLEALQRWHAIQAEREPLQARVRLLGAARLAQQAREATARHRRAALLTQSTAGPDPDLDALARQAERTAAALAAWERSPEPPALTGPTSEEIARDLETAPNPASDGDLEPAPEVVAAEQRWSSTRQAQQEHASRRPEPATRYNDLVAQRIELEDEIESAHESGHDWRLIGAAGALAVAAVAAGIFVPVPFGIVLAVIAGLGAIAAAYFTLRGGGGQRRAQLELRLREVAAQLHREAAETAGQRQAFAEWQARETSIRQAQAAAEDQLRQALERRGVEVTEPGSDLARYISECAGRSRESSAAGRRSDLQRQLEQRLQLEAAAEVGAAARNFAAAELMRVTAELGIPAAGPAEAHSALGRVQQDIGARLARAGEYARDAGELSSLLGGGTLDDLAATAAGLGSAAQRAAGGISGYEIEEAIAAEAPVAELEAARQRLDELAAEIATHDQQLTRLAVEAAAVAGAVELVAEAERRVDELQAADRILHAAQGHLKAALESVYEDVAPILTDTLRRWLPGVTQGLYTDVAVDPETLAVSVLTPEGDMRDAGALSHGTREQVYLLLRLAIVNHLTRPGEVCPLILDDATVHSDTPRTRAILQLLLELAAERQVILFTQEDMVLRWARRHLRPPQHSILQL